MIHKTLKQTLKQFECKTHELLIRYAYLRGALDEMKKHVSQLNLTNEQKEKLKKNNPLLAKKLKIK